MNLIRKLRNLYQLQRNMSVQIDYIQQALGRIETKLNQNEQDIRQTEFKVYSQWGEDGIIQHLINKIEIPNKIFVEFGVENYTESNTRFLLQNDNWSGLVIDGSEKNIQYIKDDTIYWKYNLKAETVFITIDNIDQIIQKNGIKGDIGLLSVDIDGNDYWVWDAIKSISPRIIICEYNSHFGDTHAVSVPYDESFIRSDKHYSNIYYGASISAFEFLGKKKGYSLVASNRAGNNLFFVRDDLMEDFEVVNVKDAYHSAQFREARNKNGELTFASFEQNVQIISKEQVIDVVGNKPIVFGDL